MITECLGCGYMPKPDEWAFEGSNYCIDCGKESPKKQTCHTCKGNGYLRKNVVEIHQCRTCRSQGDVYA